MKKISFNLNDIVRFKLTDKGREYVLKLNRTHPVYSRAPLKYTSDANGWIETELWDFANIFGPTMGMGFDQTVEITIEMYVPKNKQIKNVWEIQYQNDVDGDENGDESFWEWWEAKGKDMTFKCDSPKEAQWLCDVLNERENN